MRQKEILGVAFIILTVFGVITILPTDESAVCRGGFWESYNETHYFCTVNDRIEVCHHLSSTNKTCYIGVLELVVEPECSVWHMCTGWRDFELDRDCFDVTTEELNNFAKTEREDVVISKSDPTHAYKIYCLE
jgi:hypothetical protein